MSETQKVTGSPTAGQPGALARKPRRRLLRLGVLGVVAMVGGLAVVIAFILTPLANYFQMRLSLHRVLAILLAYLVLLAVIVALPLAIIEPLGTQVTEFKQDIPRILSQIQALLGHQYQVAGIVIDANAIFQQVVGSFQRILEPVVGQTLTALMDVISSVVRIVFTVVISFYLIKDGDSIRQWLEKMAPENPPR